MRVNQGTQRKMRAIGRTLLVEPQQLDHYQVEKKSGMVCCLVEQVSWCM